MTKPANSPDKPSPADTPTHREHDNGHKSVVHSADKKYTADEPHGGDIAKNTKKKNSLSGRERSLESKVLSLKSKTDYLEPT